jgi:hypothetical protein
VFAGGARRDVAPQEMIQNADDAGAREKVFCLDHRHHSTEGLRFPQLAEFHGAALLSFNSADFTEDDFKSIQVTPRRPQCALPVARGLNVMLGVSGRVSRCCSASATR